MLVNIKMKKWEYDINKRTGNMKVLTGHLTQTEKKAIKAILQAGLISGRVGRKDYVLSKENGVYTAEIFEKERACEMRRRVHTFTM